MSSDLSVAQWHGSVLPHSVCPKSSWRLLTTRWSHPAENFRGRSFPATGARLWNSLPHHVLTANSLYLQAITEGSFIRTLFYLILLYFVHVLFMTCLYQWFFSLSYHYCHSGLDAWRQNATQTLKLNKCFYCSFFLAVLLHICLHFAVLRCLNDSDWENLWAFIYNLKALLLDGELASLHLKLASIQRNLSKFIENLLPFNETCQSSSKTCFHSTKLAKVHLKLASIQRNLLKFI